MPLSTASVPRRAAACCASWPSLCPQDAAGARSAAQYLSLEVSQPGHLPLAPVARPVGQPGGLGLLNTRQRLRSLYGDAAILTLQENPIGTVVARLGVPATLLS